MSDHSCCRIERFLSAVSVQLRRWELKEWAVERLVWCDYGSYLLREEGGMGEGEREREGEREEGEREREREREGERER